MEKLNEKIKLKIDEISKLIDIQADNEMILKLTGYDPELKTEYEDIQIEIAKLIKELNTLLDNQEV